MSACQHAPLSGAALMAICGTCGEAYDAAPPVHIRGPRAATRRTGIAARRKRSETIDTAASIFTRKSVMTPLAKERAPRPAPAVVIPPLPQRAPLAAAPNVSRETVAAPRVDPLPTSPRPARRPSTLEQECRAEYDRYILAMFDRAQLEVNSMFYPGARADGCKYSAWELFTHRKTVIAKWGSEELLSFFSFNRRLSYAQFREQWRDGQRSERPELQEVS